MEKTIHLLDEIISFLDQVDIGFPVNEEENKKATCSKEVVIFLLFFFPNIKLFVSKRSSMYSSRNFFTNFWRKKMIHF